MKILAVILMATLSTLLAAKAKPDWQKALVTSTRDSTRHINSVS